MRKRVYIAGAYSANDAISVLNNMRTGMRMGARVLVAGFAPFVPWLDYHFTLMQRNGEKVSLQDYYDYSMAWLEASDVVFALPSCRHSKGAKAEIKRAMELGIPIVYSFKELIEWGGG